MLGISPCWPRPTGVSAYDYRGLRKLGREDFFAWPRPSRAGDAGGGQRLAAWNFPNIPGPPMSRCCRYLSSWLLHHNGLIPKGMTVTLKIRRWSPQETSRMGIVSLIEKLFELVAPPKAKKLDGTTEATLPRSLSTLLPDARALLPIRGVQRRFSAAICPTAFGPNYLIGMC